MDACRVRDEHLTRYQLPLYGSLFENGLFLRAAFREWPSRERVFAYYHLAKWVKIVGCYLI